MKPMRMVYETRASQWCRTGYELCSQVSTWLGGRWPWKHFTHFRAVGAKLSGSKVSDITQNTDFSRVRCRKDKECEDWLLATQMPGKASLKKPGAVSLQSSKLLLPSLCSSGLKGNVSSAKLPAQFCEIWKVSADCQDGGNSFLGCVKEERTVSQGL